MDCPSNQESQTIHNGISIRQKRRRKNKKKEKKERRKGFVFIGFALKQTGFTWDKWTGMAEFSTWKSY